MHTILVVDDEMIVCQGIKDYLERHQPGIGQVLTALNGYEALDYLRMERVDLVLTDIQMDGMNGIELMESILSEQPDIPVVVISAHDEFEYAQRCIRLGARDYLIKPVKLELLTEIVTRELGERHTRYKRLLEDSLKLRFSLAGMALLRTYMLNELLGGGGAGHADDAPFVMEQIGVELAGPAFAVMAVDLRWSRGGPGGRAPVTLRDRNLLKYAAVNIAEETLSDWRAVAFYGQGGRIMAILQLEETGDDRRADTASRLNMIGHALAANLGDYLQLDCAIGISSPAPRARQSRGMRRRGAERAQVAWIVRTPARFLRGGLLRKGRAAEGELAGAVRRAARVDEGGPAERGSRAARGGVRRRDRGRIRARGRHGGHSA
ncbi:response regulator [Cohnella ginsengisoli]|uniref:Response regulator n=1 Tax=Cohnella ginsengisoli TaxID=425004 RepID=A0A9X4KG40_9BACL|nr:response regulator [Cohnella ginsengisoli]MDG0791350.1 response regulator [Cohnella ginsengisoli]